MNWYKFSNAQKAPKPLGKVKPDNDYAKANLMFEEYRYWWEEVFQNIPVAKIEYNAWSAVREKDNIDRLKATGQMPPIIAYYNEEIDKYVLTDGNHRTNAAIKLGYTHVPALVTFKRTNPPPGSPGVEKARREEFGWQLGNIVKRFKSVDMINVEGTTDNIIQLNIGTYNIDGDYEYTAMGKWLGGYKFSFEFADKKTPGNKQQFQGTLEQIAKQIASKIVGIK